MNVDGNQFLHRLLLELDLQASYPNTIERGNVWCRLSALSLLKKLNKTIRKYIDKVKK